MVNPVASGRGRSLNGCATCRTRHIKCDEVKPACMVCQNSGYVCEGYGVRIVFDHSGKDGSSACRRPLYSEVERQAMTESLISSVPRSDPGRLLSLLDDDCDRLGENWAANLAFSTVHGPFTVFRLQNSQPLSDQDSSTQDDLLSGEDDIGFVFPEVDTIGLSPFEQLGCEVDTSWPPSLLDLAFMHTESDELVPSSTSLSLMSGFEPLVELPRSPTLYNFSSSYSGDIRLPTDAVFLLQHFHKSVIRILSPPCYEKTPWHVSFSPSVKNTLGSLAIGVPVSDVHMSIFYSILSVSAYTLRRSEQCDSQEWDNRGGFFQGKAHEYLKRSFRNVRLQSPGTSTKTAKYKDLLMSLLGLISTSMFGGQIKYAEACLFDAERVIRLKGLTKSRKSRKVRLLHHFYTYLRMLHESTRGPFEVTGRPSTHLTIDLEKSGNDAAYIESRFRFDVSCGKLMHSLSTRIKDVELAESDLHLVAPGRWVRTLYPECVGIPESFMQLLSLVIRLGNEVDIAKSCPSMTTLTLSDFANWSKELESCLLQWDPKSGLDWEADSDCMCPDDGTTHTTHQLHDLRSALGLALLIYFFRRIHDVSAVLLQDKVKQTLKILQRAGSALTDDVLYTSSHFVWPGFIAACEALDPAMQTSFADWFETCANRTGLGTFREAKKVAQLVWSERTKPHAQTFSWREILANRDGIRLFYS